MGIKEKYQTELMVGQLGKQCLLTFLMKSAKFIALCLELTKLKIGGSLPLNNKYSKTRHDARKPYKFTSQIRAFAHTQKKNI